MAVVKTPKIMSNNPVLCCIVLYVIFIYTILYEGTAVAQSLRYCATNRKIAGSIPASVSGFSLI